MEKIGTSRPRIVVVGAGFGGLWAARELARHPVDVLLLDRNNYHLFLPLLYQVAAAELESEDIACPVRAILRSLPNVAFELGEVQAVDFAACVVEANDRRIPYDSLVLATGSTSHFFGIPGTAEHALPLKTLEEGIALRNRIIRSFERAAREPEPARRRQELTFVIVGGGATGVEFAGALAELIRAPLMRDYPALDFREVRILLLEAAERLLSALPARLSAYARRRLESLGVDVRLRAAVARVTPEGVELGDSEFIPARTVAWTAGVCGKPVRGGLDPPMMRNGRLIVTPTLQLPGHPEVYAAGDVAYCEENGKPLPMMAPVAIQQGTAAARNILRRIAGLDPLPFRYRDPGLMVIVGRNAAVAQVGGRRMTGFPAWLTWLAVHIFKLIGFRNRLLVLVNWAWDYFFYERAVRLILPDASGRQIS